MDPRISSMLLCKILRETRALPMVEICGLLRGCDGIIRSAESTANVAENAATSFEIDPVALVAAYRLARRPRSLDVLGFYHSHPTGRAEPSPRDAEAAAPDGKLWLIATFDTARMWRAVSDGAVHGRFDPVAFDIIAGKRVTRSVRQVRTAGTGHRWSLEFDHFPD